MTEFVEYARGIKSGALAGVVYGIVLAAITLVAISTSSDIYGLYEPQIPEISGQTGMIILLLSFAVGTIIYLFIGLVFGVFYAIMYNFIPSQKSPTKAVLFSFLFWLVLDVLFGYPFVDSIIYFIIFNVIIGLTSAFIWGLSLGTFWDLFGEKKQEW